MTLTNHWWQLLWLFAVGGALALFMPKRREIVEGKTVERWIPLSAFLLILPYIVWTGFRSNNFGDRRMSSMRQ